ncbi:AAA family ATPase [Mycolicibacterium sp. P9-22]|uniref:AAA family ATPase n=1 Tax=Mycolicibacterium sp. P9-22 TaxID=2024613 RepID=UPI0011EF701E|nr:LuxR family transcriptional regulator [Mycolicibacterium sp. P9-22]KAA0110001.1 LuxR family transcriptional regulator [Mycolicibacterium sp. P9-22]
MDWPFVGRDAEVERVCTSLMDPKARGVVVAGPSGSGKTRLALECIARAEQSGLAVARAMATRASQGLAFGVLAQLLPPDHGGGSEYDSRPVEDWGERLRRSAATLVSRGRGRRAVLFIDDAHLLDNASAVLISQLVIRNEAVVLATIQAREPAPEPLTALWKNELVDRVELQSLASEDIQSLLAGVLKGHLDGALATEFYSRCQGDYLFLRELVHGAIDDGTLAFDDGMWTLTGPLSPSIRLVELIDSRLSNLSADERSLLELVAVGEPLSSAELALCPDAAALETLEAKDILTTRLDGRRLEVRPAHPLYGQVVRGEIPDARRRELSRRLAETVEATGARRRTDVLRVAKWRLESGGGSPDLLMAAARAARWSYDLALAQRLARAAVQVGAGFEGRLLLGQLANRRGQSVEAESILAELSVSAVNDDQRCQIGLTRMRNATWSVGPSDALRIAQEVLKSVNDRHLADEILALRCWALLAGEGPRVSAEAARDLMAHAQGKAFVLACVAAAFGIARMGRIEHGMELIDRAQATQRGLSSRFEYPHLFVPVQCEFLTYAGRLKEAESLANAQYERSVRERSVEERAHFALQLARVLRVRGMIERAAHYAREATTIFRQLDLTTFVRDGLQELAMACALGKRVQECEDALAAIDGFELPLSMHKAVEIVEARAWATAAAGDLAGARRMFEDAAALGESIGDTVGALNALHALARIGRAKDVAQRLTHAAEQVDGPLARLRASHTVALATSDAAGLEAASGAFEELGSELLAAEAAADASTAWIRAGRERRAAAAQNRAAVLAARCEGADTPALQPANLRATLTASEYETALLAAADRSNREIADELGLSVRTVENRLQHVYMKLGLSSRHQLSDAFSA